MRVKLLLIVLFAFVAHAAMSTPLRDTPEKSKQERSFKPASFNAPLPVPAQHKDEGGMGPTLRSWDATHPSAIAIDTATIAVVISFVNNNEPTPRFSRDTGRGLNYHSILFGVIISPNAP